MEKAGTHATFVAHKTHHPEKWCVSLLSHQPLDQTCGKVHNAYMPARSLYTPDRAVEVLCRLARGRSLQSVAGDPDMPSAILRWADLDPVFADHLKAARVRGPRSRAPGGRRRPQYTPALGRGICAALAKGFSLREICASPHVPVTPNTVWIWARKRPDFAAAYAEATRPRPGPRGLVIGRGRHGAYTPERAEAIIDRLLEGRALEDICRDPDMPSSAVVKQWRRRNLDFHLALNDARRFQFDLLLDDVLAAADTGRSPGKARRIIASLARWGVEPYSAARGDWEGAAEAAAPGIGHNWRGR